MFVAFNVPPARLCRPSSSAQSLSSESQRLRNEVLDTSVEDFHQYGETLEKVTEHGAVVVLGADEAIRSAGIFEEVKKVL